MYVCVYVSICATEKFIKGAENYVVERLFNDQKKKKIKLLLWNRTRVTSKTAPKLSRKKQEQEDKGRFKKPAIPHMIFYCNYVVCLRP